MYNDEEALKKEIDKYSGYKNIYKCLALLLQDDAIQLMKQYLIENDIHNLVIYGAGSVGRVFYECIKRIDTCNVLGVVDKSRNTTYGFNQFMDISELETLSYDLCVITPVNKYNVISKDLKKRNIFKYCHVLELIDYSRRKELYENGIFS